MPRSQAPLIAREGLPFIAAAVAAVIVGYHLFDWSGLAGGSLLLLLTVLIFRDPYRDVPSVPFGVFSPVDGRVVQIEPSCRGILPREATCITIRINNFGAYTIRSPIEGKVLSLREHETEQAKLQGVNGLWVQNEARDDVVLLFRGPAFIGRPTAFIRYGERIGQGKRCAFLRLARYADLYLPVTSRVSVNVGEAVKSGSSLLATLIHK
ncbi:phosphatidylserine decarboxylase [soil metagenome]